jgi:hypothetical protein
MDMVTIGNRQAVVTVEEVENPMWSKAHDGDRTNPRRIQVFKNARESELAVLRRAGSIDDSQMMAGDTIRSLFEAMGGTGARAMDTTKEFVDGGRFPDPIGTHAIDAGKKLAAANHVLVKEYGEYAWRIVIYICGQGVSVQQMTSTRRQADTMRDNIGKYLALLAEHWGYSTVKKRA